MALEGPQLIYTRKVEEEETGDVLTRALRLAREMEELLEESSSSSSGAVDLRGAHSTRIVRAMAASLVDELEALVRGTRKRNSLA
jgi:hypothetical protein